MTTEQPPLFVITRQASRQGYDAEGLTPTTTWTINYDTPSVKDNVLTVDQSDYTPAKVKELLTAAATNIEAVHALTPESSDAHDDASAPAQ